MAIEVNPRMVQISVGATDAAAVNFTDELDSGELLTGTPTVVEVTTSDLTISNIAVSTSALTILEEASATGTAVQFVVTGQQVNTVYELLITATTDSTPSRVLPYTWYLSCV